MSASRPASAAPRRGFTLLEVLVAVSILGLALTTILSSQLGLVTSAQRSANISIATQLVRCRMNEVELKLAKDGYPQSDLNDEGPCCTDRDDPMYRCEWKVEKIELPSPIDAQSRDGGLTGSSPGGLGALGALSQVGQQGQSALGQGQGISGLSGVLAGAASAGAAGMAPLVMGLVYPDLKPMLEASIRRVSVRVSWREGITERDYSVVQYVTNPMQGGLQPNAAAGISALGDRL
jgi:general secretion pathway protein I